MSDVVQAAGEVTDATHLPNPNEAPAPQESQQQGTPTPAPDARPEWLPEKFADGAALAESYKQLEQKLHDPDRQEQVRQTLIDEIASKKLEGVPENAEGYKIPEAFGGEEAADTINSDLWSATKDWAYERNLTQDDLSELVSFYTENFLPDISAEFEKLGAEAQSRANALGSWVGANVPEQHREAIMNMAVTAQNFEALEALMKLTVPQSLPGQNSVNEAGTKPVDEGEIQRLMMSPEYTDPGRRNPAVVKQVEDWFRTKYPNT